MAPQRLHVTLKSCSARTAQTQGVRAGGRVVSACRGLKEEEALTLCQHLHTHTCEHAASSQSNLAQGPEGKDSCWKRHIFTAIGVTFLFFNWRNGAAFLILQFSYSRPGVYAKLRKLTPLYSIAWTTEISGAFPRAFPRAFLIFSFSFALAFAVEVFSFLLPFALA